MVLTFLYVKLISYVINLELDLQYIYIYNEKKKKLSKVYFKFNETEMVITKCLHTNFKITS